jgi:hypothetical protein
VVIEGYGPSPFSSMGCLFDDDREEEMVYHDWDQSRRAAEVRR